MQLIERRPSGIVGPRDQIELESVHDALNEHQSNLRLPGVLHAVDLAARTPRRPRKLDLTDASLLSRAPDQIPKVHKIDHELLLIRSISASFARFEAYTQHFGIQQAKEVSCCFVPYLFYFWNP